MPEPPIRPSRSSAQWVGLFAGPLLALIVYLALPVWALLTRTLYPVHIERIEGGRRLTRSAYEELGPVKRGKWVTAGGFFLTAASWILWPLLVHIEIAGFATFGGLTDAGIAMTAGLLLFVIPVNLREPVFVMAWDGARQLRVRHAGGDAAHCDRLRGGLAVDPGDGSSWHLAQADQRRVDRGLVVGDRAPHPGALRAQRKGVIPCNNGS